VERPLLIAAYYCEFWHTAAKLMSGGGGLSRRACGQGYRVEFAGRPQVIAFLFRFSIRTRCRGSSSGALSARDQSAGLHYQMAEPSRPEPCDKVVRPSKKSVLHYIAARLL